MWIIKASSPASAWIKTTKYLIEEGVNVGGIREILNVCIEITGFNFNKDFDSYFREVFGDERIDYASAITFVKPKEVFGKLVYRPIKEKWYNSYFGRMCRYRNEFNQIEYVISILKKGHNVKRCELIIYDPLKDAKNMYKQPCLLAIDLKPRNGKLYLTAFFRSQRVSKSGYADYTALVNLGKFLCSQSDMELAKVTVIATSCHLTSQNKELINSRRLLALLGEI